MLPRGGWLGYTPTMRIFPVLLLAVPLAFGQSSPDFSGVWKANGEKTKMERPLGDTAFYLWVTQSGTKVQEKTLLMGAHFEQRSESSYDTSGEPTTNMMRGEKFTSKASLSGGTMSVETSGAMEGHEMTLKETWTLSDGNKTLTVVRNTGRGEDTIVFDRQPDSESSVFTNPPRMAKDVYQNVKELQVPAYMLGPVMQSFTKALGVNCAFCHVPGKMDSDEKRSKVFARTMIHMTQGIDQDVFHGRPRVTCYTCHRGQEEPPARPPETAAAAMTH